MDTVRRMLEPVGLTLPKWRTSVTDHTKQSAASITFLPGEHRGKRDVFEGSGRTFDIMFIPDISTSRTRSDRGRLVEVPLESPRLREWVHGLRTMNCAQITTGFGHLTAQLNPGGSVVIGKILSEDVIRPASRHKLLGCCPPGASMRFTSEPYYSDALSYVVLTLDSKPTPGLKCREVEVACHPRRWDAPGNPHWQKQIIERQCAELLPPGTTRVLVTTSDLRE